MAVNFLQNKNKDYKKQYWNQNKLFWLFILGDIIFSLFSLLTIPLSSKEIYLVTPFSSIQWNLYSSSPLLVLFIKSGTFFLGQNVFGVRIFGVLMGIFSKFFLWDMCIDESSQKNQIKFILFYYSIPVLVFYNSYSSSITYLIFFLLLLFWTIKNGNNLKPFYRVLLLLISLLGILYSDNLGLLSILLYLIIDIKVIKRNKFFIFCLLCAFLLYTPYLYFLYPYNKINIEQTNDILHLIKQFIIYINPFVLLAFFFNIKTIILKKSRYVIIFGVFLLAIFFTSFFRNIYLVDMSLIGLIIFILIYNGGYLKKINPLYLRLNYFIILPFVLYCKLFIGSDIFYNSKEAINYKEVMFLNKLLPKENIIILNNPVLASTLSFYSDRNIASISSEVQNTNVPIKSDWNIPIKLNNVIFITSDNFPKNYSSPNVWDTIFYSNQNFCYRRLDTFIYYKVFQAKNIRFKKNSQTNTNQIIFSLESPSAFYTPQDVTKIEIGLLIYKNSRIQSKYKFSNISAVIIDSNNYEITINIDKKEQEELQHLIQGTDDIIRLSFLQNGEFYYTNSERIYYDIYSSILN